MANKSNNTNANKHEINYRKRLKREKPGVQLVGAYHGSKTKTLHTCHCGNKWTVSPEKVLKQKGCRKCSQRQSPKIYASYLKAHRPELTNLEDYVTNSHRILHRCNVDNCGWEWHVTPNSIKDQGVGCPKCALKKNASRRSHTQERYVAMLREVNTNVAVVGTYKTNHINIDHKCLDKMCGHVWLARPSNIKSGKGCPECEKKAKRQRNKAGRIPHEKFVAQIKKVNPDIEIVGTYETAKTKIECECLKQSCRHIWFTKPGSLKAGKGCPRCGIEKAIAAATRNKMSHDSYVKFVDQYRPDLEVIGHYENTETKILHRCRDEQCLHSWDILPRDVKRLSAPCPKCSKRTSDTAYAWQDDNDNWKIGVTLERRAQARINEVSKAHNTGVRRARIAVVGKGKAITVERALLEHLQTVPNYTPADGYSEFRTLSKEESTWLNLVFDDLINYKENEQKIDEIINGLFP
ncbi:hypothetical protein EDB59_0878 [Vibrio crassostreae]|uniref:zinc-ribbon domain-containing protein n=1 Tax=Vibrio crassostreae TaxID=246167 RepID=UPI000F4AAA67|nr:zinc-ribbon domain-containing protein [Vibrio crassostreae]ROR70229.1 hypothetical protein EDB59_0878 [Vibrio crassostreae]